MSVQSFQIIVSICGALVAICGTIGTLTFAWLVWQTNKAQHRENRRAGDLQLALQREQFRLALLDRRMAVIAKIDETLAAWQGKGAEIAPGDLFPMVEALVTAPLVFGDDLVVQIRELDSLIWQIRTDQLGIKDIQTPEQHSRWVDKSVAQFQDMRDKAEALRTSLREATRISLPAAGLTPPPLVPAPATLPPAHPATR
jgi:hypothetical protein